MIALPNDLSKHGRVELICLHYAVGMRRIFSLECFMAPWHTIRGSIKWLSKHERNFLLSFRSTVSHPFSSSLACMRTSVLAAEI
jgi:hypothetical protein